MNSIPAIPRILLPLLLAAVLAACDSGVGTTANPNLSQDSDTYTGPAARTEDIRSFQLNFWEFLRKDNRCGQCHGVGQAPAFVDLGDVNKAYSQAIRYADLQDPASSAFVSKVGGGHQCWLPSLSACASTIEQMISNWATDSNVTSARLIALTAPALRDPGEAKSFPPSANTPGTNGRSFADTVYPLLTGTAPLIADGNCQNCHEESRPQLPQAPFFASLDVDSAYEAAKSKMNIDAPERSRFVERLEQQHNCWSDCPADAISMTAAIALFAEGIDPTEVDITLRTSKALTLGDGIVASGGNRHESNLVALWEFKTRQEAIAYDTSGIDPAINLALISDSKGSVTWLSNYGLDFQGGRAQALTFESEKLHTFIQATGEYAVEAWVVPANVTQADANIVSYSGSDSARNFTLGQDMYDYEFFNRVVADPARPNGDPFLSTGANNEELAKSSLQHVVANYDPINGRSIYINGVLVDVSDPVPGPTTINNVWNDGFTLILGNETSGERPWYGHLRMLAIHNRTLTPGQIQQNFDVGVGEKFFLLFYIGHRIGIADSYIMFEVSQYDEYSYLFNKPTFINLDPGWTPTSIRIKGMRIGINGKEALAGQAYANLDTTVGGNYDAQFGELLSPLGTIISLEKSASTDEFFLTFELIGTESRLYTEAQPGVPSDPADPAEATQADIGLRTFEEINATIAEITGVPVTNPAVKGVYDSYMQQLPTVENIGAFLPSHQMAIAQLALTSCSEMVNSNPGFFTGFDFNQSSRTAFGPVAPGVPDSNQQANRNQVILPMLQAVMNVDPVTPANNLSSQPAEADINDLLGKGDLPPPDLDTGTSVIAYDSLITTMINTCTPVPPATDCVLEDSIPRTAQIVKAVCAAATGAAVMLVQ
jgi:hypothetical protein